MTRTITVDATLTLDVHHAGNLAVCLAATSSGTTESLLARAPTAPRCPYARSASP